MILNAYKMIFHPCKMIFHAYKMIFHPCKMVFHAWKMILHVYKRITNAWKMVFHAYKIVLYACSSQGPLLLVRTVSHPVAGPASRCLDRRDEMVRRVLRTLQDSPIPFQVRFRDYCHYLSPLSCY